MSEDRKKNIWEKIAIFGGVALLIAILGIIFIPSSVKNESAKDEENKSSYLICTNENDLNYVLLDNYEAIKYDLRLKFINDELSSINLIVSAKYDNKDSAVKFTNDIHAKYNIYVGDHNVPSDAITPSYSHADNTGKMSLYATGDNLDYRNSALFFIESGVVDKNGPSDYMKHYAKNGFSCVLR